jgi:hypothetical protein
MSTSAPASVAKPQTLDELMLAMDVVDTLRHQDNLVSRELDETRRESELIERLRSIYKGQGIEVSDDVLRQGVQAIREERFVYVPPKPGLGTSLAKLWIARRKVGKTVGAAMLALGLGSGGWWFGVEQPRRAETARIESMFTQTLPASLTQAHRDAMVEARQDQAKARIDQLLTDGRVAIQRRDEAGARQKLLDLENLRSSLVRSYQLRIVSRPGEPSAVWRVPRGNPNARNHYAIVEAVDANGRVLTLPIRSEEDAQSADVTKFGVRIPQTTFDAIATDKREDGIVQRNIIGEKKRGDLDISYSVPVLGGFITKW